MRYEISRTLPAPRREGYEYLTDLTTWSEWSPISIPSAGDLRFSRIGDVAPFGYRPLGIPMKGTMRLVDVEPGESWHVCFEQRAFMDVDMLWTFENAGAHAFTLTVAVEIEDSEWWDKTYEWVSMIPLWIRRDIRQAFEALHKHFLHPDTGEIATAAS